MYVSPLYAQKPSLPPQTDTEQVEAWVAQNLQKWLKLDSVDEIVDHVLRMDNDDDIKKYLTDLIGNSKSVQKFIDNLLVKKRAYIPRRVPELPDDAVIYKRKDDDDDDRYTIKKEAPKQKKEPTAEQKEQKEQQKQEAKKKAKQGNRELCDCQATEHSLIGNCLNCGKIICAKEGKGPCLFCGENPDKTSASAVVSKTDLEKAVKHKDQLIEYERSSAKRTVVYDDQSDYYSVNNWLNPQEREKMLKAEEELRRKREEAKKTRKITFDLAGRKVLMEDEPTYGMDQLANNTNEPADSFSSLANPYLSIRPEFVSQETKKPKAAPGKSAVPSQESSKSNKKKKTIPPPQPKISGVSKRIQHEYYSVEPSAAEILDEPVISNTRSRALKSAETNMSDEPQCKANLSTGENLNMFDIERAFNTCGIIEYIPPSEQSKSLKWSMEHRKTILQLMAIKGVNHYTYIISPIVNQSAETVKVDWATVAKPLMNEIQEIATQCRQQRVDFDLGVEIPTHIDYASNEELQSLTSFLISTAKSIRMHHFTLIFQKVEVTPALKKKFKSIGTSQSTFAAQVIKKINEALEAIVFHILPAIPYGAFDEQANMSRMEIEYWNDFNRNIPPSSTTPSKGSDIIFLFQGSRFMNSAITSLFANKLLSFFKSRKFVLWDNFPFTSASNPNLTFLGAYEGREPSLHNINMLEGLLICPMPLYAPSSPSSNNSANIATTQLFSIFTAFDFMQAPTTYDSASSLKAALLNTVYDDRISEDLFHLIEVAPHAGPELANKAVPLSVLIKKFQSQQTFEELQDRIHRIRNSRSLAAPLKASLESFFHLVEVLIESNMKQFRLVELQRTGTDSATYEAAKKERDAAQRKFDLLLNPNAEQTQNNSSPQQTAPAKEQAAQQPSKPQQNKK